MAYKQANIELIRRAIDNFDWNRALDNVSPNRQFSIFNDTILNVISNFIPHETIICDDTDPLKSYMKKIKNIRNTLITNQTFYFYKTLIICRLK